MLADLDAARHAVRLEAAGSVDGVAPQVVDELVAADDAGDHGTAVHADADRQLDAETVAEACHGVLHRERHLRRRLGMVVSRLGEAGSDHVGVADGLDLLHPEPERERVEGAEDLVEQSHDPNRLRPRHERGEVHDVGEQDCDFEVFCLGGAYSFLASS